jgi:hypothetical protein
MASRTGLRVLVLATMMHRKLSRRRRMKFQVSRSVEVDNPNNLDLDLITMKQLFWSGLLNLEIPSSVQTLTFMYSF